jgi:hypothetical protein
MMSRALQHCRHAVLAAAMAVGACQTGPKPELQTILADESRIRFEHPDFLPELTEYALERDSRVGSEAYLASFHGAEARALGVALKAGPGYVFNHASTEALAARLFPDSELHWSGSGRAVSGLGLADYRFFRFDEAPLSCVAFNQVKGETGDVRGRKSVMVYGYFCRDELHPLTMQAAEDLLSNLSLRGSRARPRTDPAKG